MVIKYPGWRYHPTEKARIVQNEAEAAELGPGWSDTPGGSATVEPEPAPVPEGREPVDQEPDAELDALYEPEKKAKKPGKK